ALDKIVAHALARERDLRYQSLKELQIDAEPTLISLRKARAEQLVFEAQDQFARKELDSAQALLQQGLALDPENTPGRQLRDSLQVQLRRRSTGYRIETLLRRAEEELRKGGYINAIQDLESALRLDPEYDPVRERLEYARGRAESVQRAKRHLSDAQRDLGSL